MARILSVSLGMLFLVTGIGKVLMLDAFAGTVSGIVYIPIPVGLLIALVVVLIEVAGGLALIADFKVRQVSLIFCLVVAVFIWVLSSAILQGKEITCNCFGILGIRLTNAQELLLDMVLFNAFGALAYMSQEKTEPIPIGRKKSEGVWSIGLVLLLAVLEFVLVKSVLDAGRFLSKADAAVAVRYAETADAGFAAQSESRRVLLLVRSSDMGCPPCALDFFRLVDSLRLSVGDSSHRVVALFDRDGDAMLDTPESIREWADAHHFPFPVLVAPETLADSLRLAKSTVVVIDGDGQELFSARLPMGLTKLLLAQQLMRR